MAKQAIFTCNGDRFEAALVKVDRDKLYGFVEEVVTDEQGRPCVLGSILDDGKTLLVPGSTQLRTVDDKNRELDKKALKVVNTDGTDAVLAPSVFDAPVELKKEEPDRLFDLEVNAVYQLTEMSPESQKSMLKLFHDDAVYGFAFNYRSDYEAADAFMLSDGKEVFILAGRLLEFSYLDNRQMLQLVDDEPDSDADEPLDFAML
jgi:hypothetical protein